MTKDIRTERRWLRSVIAASTEPLPSFPWMKGQKKRPAALATDSAESQAPAMPHRGTGLFGHKGAVAAR